VRPISQPPDRHCWAIQYRSMPSHNDDRAQGALTRVIRDHPVPPEATDAAGNRSWRQDSVSNIAALIS